MTMLIRVVHGANDAIFSVAGKTVASVRRSLRTAFNIPDDAVALVSGVQVDGDHRLLPGEHLEFLKEYGAKGALEPDERALLERVARDVEALKTALAEGRIHQTLNGTERAILKALGDKELKGAAIARRMNSDLTSSVKATLSGLVKRGILGKGRNGYFVRSTSISPAE